MLLSKWSCALTLLSTLWSTYATSMLTSIGSNDAQRREAGTYVQAAYFTNWGIYAADFQPTDIDPSQLTHILYAFADVSAETGEVVLTDSWADEQKHFAGDSWNDQGNNLYGCLKQLYLLKLANRNLKVLLSIGGWTYSQAGHFGFLADSARRDTFAASAARFVKDYGFDGIDIDFEYPTNEAEGQGLLDVVRSVRRALDDLAIANGETTPYELMAAVSAGAQHYAYYPIPQLNDVLTYWNLMAYDYAGSWLSFADNQANLYGGSRTGVSTASAISHYVASGATPGKIIMGIPLYGRAFENTDGIGQPYSGVGPGTHEAGVYAYAVLPLPGAHVYEDMNDVTSYSYDPVKRELVSYDVPDVVRAKARYVRAQSLGGCMFWELSMDKKGPESLVGTARATLGELDQTPNHVRYPNSKWDNVRNNMAGSTVVGTTSASPSLAPTTSPSPTHTAPDPPSCLCADVSSWSSTTIYWGGDETTHDDHLWTAKWWTENDVPGGPADVWMDEGKCD